MNTNEHAQESTLSLAEPTSRRTILRDMTQGLSNLPAAAIYAVAGLVQANRICAKD